MKSEDISLLLTEGRAFRSSSFLLKTLIIRDILDISIPKTDPKKRSKTAFLASKKLFKTAVLRNRARRRARAGLIKALGKSHKNLDFGPYYLVFTLNKAILTVKMEDLVEEMSQILVKSAI